MPRVHTFDPSYIGAVDRGPPTAPTYQAIPKPPGQVTRIKRGGYRLIEVLAWDEEYYKNVQVRLLHPATDAPTRAETRSRTRKTTSGSSLLLFPTEPAAGRSCMRQGMLSTVTPHLLRLSTSPQARQQMRDRRVYEDDWHIKDFLRVYLHNSSREYRVSLKAGRV